MKTVELTSGEKAIPVITKTYLTFPRVVYIWGDLIHRGSLSYSSKKSEVMKEIRRHIWYQGITTYSDWYEDTDDIPVLNAIYDDLRPIVKEMFSELL